MCSFNKLRNKNKFSIFNLTRNNNTCLMVIILVIIKVLLYLYKSIHFIICKIFTFLNFFYKRKMFHKLTSSSNTSNPFFKSNIRLCIIYSSICITSHHVSCMNFSIWFTHSRCNKSIYQSFSKNSWFFKLVITILIFNKVTIFICNKSSNSITSSNSIFDCYSSKFIILIYFNL